MAATEVETFSGKVLVEQDPTGAFISVDPLPGFIEFLRLASFLQDDPVTEHMISAPHAESL